MAARWAPSLIAMTAVLLSACRWNLAGVDAVYDSQVLEYNCRLVPDDRAAMSQTIFSITDSLIIGTRPGPPGAYLCAAPNRRDDQPDVWAMACCEEGITKKDCEDCLANARNGLMSYECPGMAGAHVWRADCFLRYESYEFCRL